MKTYRKYSVNDGSVNAAYLHADFATMADACDAYVRAFGELFEYDVRNDLIVVDMSADEAYDVKFNNGKWSFAPMKVVR
jgi:hypothetical protein